MKRGLCILLGLYLSVVAFVGLDAMIEHQFALKGRQWLEHILPFGLATDMGHLAIVTFGALAGAGVLFWVAKTS